MENIAIEKADELPSDARRAVEQVLGRALEHDEEVSIMALSPHEAPTGEARKAFARQLEDRIKKTAERVRDVSTEEQESAIDAAVNYVRSQQRVARTPVHGVRGSSLGKAADLKGRGLRYLALRYPLSAVPHGGKPTAGTAPITASPGRRSRPSRWKSYPQRPRPRP